MRSVLFARALASPPVHRSRHFALHHVPGRAGAGKLSTDGAPKPAAVVDDLFRSTGVLVPKRHARRAVTRSLLKRLALAALERVASRLDDGFWLVRVRASFESADFPSASSDALRAKARGELDRLAIAAAASVRKRI